MMIGTGGSEFIISTGTGSEEYPINGTGVPPVRGDLVISPGEVITLTGSHDYSSASLGSGSVVTIDNCDMTVSGGADGSAIFSGSPSVLLIRNSTIRVFGSDGSGLVSSEGSPAVFDITSSGPISIEYSMVYLMGGKGYETSERGAYFERDLGGGMFAGGNASMMISPGNGRSLVVKESTLRVEGGAGGDAPSGEDVTSDATGRSGGYTIGGDVSGFVGSGGQSSLEVEADSSGILIGGTEITVIGGNGGDAGHAGSVIWSGDAGYNVQTPAGGYTSGGLDGGDIISPGTVSGNVGCGGNASIAVDAVSLTLISSFVNSRGGSGGDAGNGGNCRAVGGTGDSITRTNGGGGGGGYAGGLSGGVSGDRGGDVLGRVGSGGSASVSIRAVEGLTYCDSYIQTVRNFGGQQGIGGSGGGYDGTTSFDGGGGGGGGYSGGAGGPARTTTPVPTGGRGGDIGPLVGGGGSNSLSIESPHFMASGLFRIRVDGGTPGMILSGMDGENGEVGAEFGKMGGPGGSGSQGSIISGERYWSFPPPSPLMNDPRDGSVVSDPGLTFNWNEAVSDHWGTGAVTYDFRLLSGPDAESVVQEISTDDTGTQLNEDPGDGIWFWTVRCGNSTAVSNWSVPASVVIDRSPPSIEGPECRTWVPASDPSILIGLSDDLSGIDPSGSWFRYGVAGEGLSGWCPMDIVENDQDSFGRIVLPPEEGSYEVWSKISDLAGNGPTIAGPFTIDVDGTAPVISGISPSRWTTGERGIEFEAEESGSGLSGTGEIIIHDLDANISSMLEPLGGNVYRMSGISDLPEGAHSMTVVVSDIAGNTAESGPVALLIDGSDPVVVLKTPVHGSWLNTSFPVVEGSVGDPLSGICSIFYTISNEGGTVVINRSLSPEDSGSFSAEVSQDLPDGLYELWIGCSDDAGNAVLIGPTGFGIDTVDPSVEILGAEARPSGNVVDIEFSSPEELSGIEFDIVEILMPSVDGWEKSSVLRFDGGGRTGSEERSVSVPADSSLTAVYFRMHSADRANNSSPSSPVRRVDLPGSEPTIDVACGEVIGPEDEIEITLTDPSNIDPESIQYRIEEGNSSG
ncbi:MAG: hypothetical protein ACMUIG_07380, partial [Thermoplasmatota archaeon]